jgi:serine/threonine protein kinase
MVADKGLLLIDFDCAYFPDLKFDRVTVRNFVDIPHAPPEAMKQALYNPSTSWDIWSVGMLVCFTTHTKILGTYQTVKYPEPEIPVIKTDYSQKLKNFCNECFQINQDNRPSAEQLMESFW